MWIYPDDGSTPVRIAQGGLVVQPLSGQLDPSARRIWIVDKATASLYEISMPDPEVFETLFPYRGQFTDPITSMPSVSEWSLVLMTLLALTVGTILFGRRTWRAAA